MPLSGDSFGEAQTVVNAIKQAIEEEQQNLCQGRLSIVFESYNDSALNGKNNWDPEQVRKNAEKIAQDAEVVAVIGHYNSGATKVSLPILNQANVVMVSPANTYPGLTKPGKGEEGEPKKFYPTGKQTYARVVPADDLQGAVAARWALSLGIKSVYVTDDGDTYGKGVADVFEASAKELGIKVLGRTSISRAENYRDIASQIAPLQPDLVYYGGIAGHGAGYLLRDLREQGLEGTSFMGADSMVVQLFMDQALEAAEGAYATFPGIPFDVLQGDAKTWYENYKKRFGSEPQPYALYGFEAAKVVLKAIGKVCRNDREAIREAVLSTQNYQGLLGEWSFDPNGDTTLTLYGGFQVKNGVWEYVTTLK
jgi:branched-chain amino acid transport system substrate-binding protein